MSAERPFDVVVIGGGPAGTAASMRAADLGARTALVTHDAFGGMAANTGPIPVRTLAHAARLAREARQLQRYGIVTGGAASLDYPRLIARAFEVVDEARAHSTLLAQVRTAGASVFENAGNLRFTGAHSLVSESGLALRGEAIVICTGGVSRSLEVPGAERTVTPADAFSLTELPASMLVIGAGATGMQVASVFGAFGTRVTLCQAGPRIAPTEDDEVCAELARAYREDGIDVREGCGHVRAVEPAPSGVRAIFPQFEVEAELAVRCTGWIADTAALNLAAAGVHTNGRGFIAVDEYLRTNVAHIFAAGDVLGRDMLVPQAVRDGYLAGGNAVNPRLERVPDDAAPIGSFTDPEYAKVGLTQAQACERHDILVSRATYAETTRPIVDGRTRGFCKLVADRASREILGCHIVGERAVEVAQMAAIAMTADMKLDQLARVLLSFPTYANVLGRAALRALRELGEPLFSEA